MRMFSEKSKSVSNIGSSSAIFLSNSRGKERKVKISIHAIILRSKTTNGLDDRIKSDGSGDKKGHRGYKK
jgi:hypothetical protein